MISAIVAYGNQLQIGMDGQLPWHNPDDLKWFREMTMGKTCVVGYNTLKTLPELPGRNVVLDDIGLTPMQMWGVHGDLIIIGGAKTYARWAPYIMRWHVGRIDSDAVGDTFFDLSWMVNR